MTEEKKNDGAKKNRRRRPNRRRPQKKDENQAKSDQANGNKSSRPRKNSQRRRRSNNRNSNRSPKGIDQIVTKYYNLVQQHLVARKKYFEYYHRADPKQLAKIERNFYSTLDRVREFESKLSGEELEKFKNHIDGLSHDRDYSNNHNLDPLGDEPDLQGPFEDPHYLVSQKETDFSSDTEESSGSMEDYLSYKEGGA